MQQSVHWGLPATTAREQSGSAAPPARHTTGSYSASVTAYVAAPYLRLLCHKTLVYVFRGIRGETEGAECSAEDISRLFSFFQSRGCQIVQRSFQLPHSLWRPVIHVMLKYKIPINYSCLSQEWFTSEKGIKREIITKVQEKKGMCKMNSLWLNTGLLFLVFIKVDISDKHAFHVDKFFSFAF